MPIIKTNDALRAFCQHAATQDYMTIDTEFIREKTYYPQLCLVQMATKEKAVMVDPLAEGINLAPIYELLVLPSLIKVFHAARQDIEIFYHLSGRMPHPIFDTQIAASVCGHGEAASYESLVNHIAEANIDKSSRYSDWAARPLSEAQLSYALSDVTHLRVIYEKLKAQIEKEGRSSWIEEEFAMLTDPNLYDIKPEEAYQRIKAGSLRSKHLVVLRELAGWREQMARKNNVPRGRIAKDEVLIELALVSPKNEAELQRIRNIQSGLNKKYINTILEGVQTALALPQTEWPQVKKGRKPPSFLPSVLAMLQLLLKVKADQHGIAASVIASKDDLESFALGEEGSLLMLGWRYDLFGADALRLLSGKLRIGFDPKTKQVVWEEIGA